MGHRFGSSVQVLGSGTTDKAYVINAFIEIEVLKGVALRLRLHFFFDCGSEPKPEALNPGCPLLKLEIYMLCRGEVFKLKAPDPEPWIPLKGPKESSCTAPNKPLFPYTASSDPDNTLKLFALHPKPLKPNPKPYLDPKQPTTLRTYIRKS